MCRQFHPANIRLALSAAALTLCSLISVPAVQAQDLFESDSTGHDINVFTSGGIKSTFTAGLITPQGLAFDSSGNLFVGDAGSIGSTRPTIYKFTPDGVGSVFANTGLNSIQGLAFDSSGNLFESNEATGIINEFTPGGVESTFATGLNGPFGLVFQPTALSTPEPGAAAMLASITLIGAVFFRRRR